MTFSRLLFLPAGLSALLLMGCPTDSRRNTYDYLRAVVTFRIDPVASAHPFCSDPAKRLFPTEQECRDARKYRLRWERPEDTVGFTEYRIFVDTTPPNAPGVPWAQLRKDRNLSHFIMTGRPAAADSIIFVVSGSGGVLADRIPRDSARIVALDTTGRVDSLGRLVFAISTAYGQAGVEGQPRYEYIITNDRFKPDPLLPVYTPKARSVEISWSRPRDRTNFFDPTADSGIIKGYMLRVRRATPIRTGQPAFNPGIVYIMGGVNRSAEVTYADYTVRGFPARRFWLPDSHRVFDRLGENLLDSLHATVNGLAPQDTVDISLWALDSSNNFTDSSNNAVTRLLLTDTTQPTTPVLELVAGSVTRNGFIYTYTASRDLVESGSGLVPAATPNANIREYRISRRRVGGSAGGTASVDRIFKLESDDRLQTLFTDTVRYLPPGAIYEIYVQAVDSTGHLSAQDTLQVATPAAQLTGADSASTCPPGFIAIPGGSFRLGDSTGSAQADESPGVRRPIKSYCIEPYEHRDSTGAFQTRVTWEQARDACAEAAPSAQSHLCTEAEWERACEGIEAVPLVYGIQSELRDPNGVRYTCNIGTNDSSMAITPSLRDPNCLSYDGVFDMAGNFAEWVLDPYTSSYSSVPDTLRPGVPLTTPLPTSRRVIRGSSYLNPNLTPSALLRSARCANRDEPTQVRPRPYPGCVDSVNPRLAVIYGSKPPRCFVLPDSLLGKTITSIAPARDTNQILLLLQNQTQPVTFVMPVDTAYKGLKATSAQLTARTLAVVSFENSETSEVVTDTLDALEMQGASPASLAAIFAREAAPPWSARMDGGQYAIRYLYAYVRLQSLQAKPNYSNRAIGFRCCSSPVAPELGKRVKKQ